MKKIGIFGGTFDPIHTGHIEIAKTAKERMALDMVVFVPSGDPPHKSLKNARNKEDRLTMTELATSSYDFFSVSDYEIKKNEKSYSVNLIKHFKEVYKEDELYFIIGADSLYNLPLWYHYEELMEMVTFIVLSRPHQLDEKNLLDKFKGTEKPFRAFFIDDVSIDISATEIRDKIKNGQNVKDILPQLVYRYIIDNGLYV